MNEKITRLLQQEKAFPTGALAKLFADNLKEWRDARGLTQKQTALKLAVPISTYANWEQGRREPSLFGYYNIMCAFDIDANDLFFGV